ncbi:hypothetical protein E2C01_084196 [Portunus trituberculatus]|uniref:Uncharacterized protein n=1 Tax=Portunus trituberculatus TaxID=210409 RepID=A0A5B7J3M5_PORTR|nr:hypothetical protein [Portunus trituberculatus]
MVSCVPSLRYLQPAEAFTLPANSHSSRCGHDCELQCAVLLTAGDPLHLGRVMYLAQRTSLGARGQERPGPKITNLALQGVGGERQGLTPTLSLPGRQLEVNCSFHVITFKTTRGCKCPLEYYQDKESQRPPYAQPTAAQPCLTQSSRPLPSPSLPSLV